MKSNNAAGGSRDLTARYSLIFFFYWMSLVAGQSYASFFLLDAGLSNTQIGLLLAVAGTLSAVLQPSLASFADRPKSPSVRFLMIEMAGILLIFSILLMILFHGNVGVTAVLFLGTYLLILLQQPFANAIGTESLNAGNKLNIGFSRAMGSLGYTIGAFILGRISVKAGPIIVPAAIMFTSITTILFTGTYPKIRKDEEGEELSSEDEKTAMAATGSFFRRYPQFGVALAGLALVFIGHTYINSFLLQIVQSKGAGSGQMGNLMSFAALLELLLMLVYSWFRKIKPDHFWFRISSIFFTLKILMTLLVPGVGGLYLVQFFQPLGWGFLSVSVIYYINDMMGGQDKVKGQAFFTATFTIGSVLGSLTGGFLLDHGGVTTMLVFGTIMSAVGSAAMILSAKVPEHGKKY